MAHVGAMTLLLASTPALATAQQWHMGVQGGRIRSSIDPAAVATGTLSAGVRTEAPRTAFGLVGGIPTADDEPLWGSASLWHRAAITGERGFLAGVDLSGVGFLSHDRTPGAAPLPGGGGIFDRTPAPPVPAPNRSGHALAGQVLPLIGYESATVQVHARGGVAHFAARLGGGRVDRTVVLADLQVTALPWRSVALVPTVRHFSVPDAKDATYAGLTVVLASTRGRASGTLGHWAGLRGVGTPWAVATRAGVSPRIAIDVAARRDVLDPLYQQPAQTSWSAGLSYQIGGRVGPARLPVPANYTDGYATLELPARSSDGSPSIAGDFTNWQPVRMDRDGGKWRYVLRLPPGVYHYAFVDASGRWFVPKDVPGRREDGMGGHVAVVVVE